MKKTLNIRNVMGNLICSITFLGEGAFLRITIVGRGCITDIYITHRGNVKVEYR